MIGVARELAAYLNRPLRLPNATVAEAGKPVSDLTSIGIDDPELCRRYIGRVIVDIQPGRTPLWMVQRLIHAGQRLVNPIVDITNYVLLETGHPLHAFDYDMLAEHRIVVRRARPGETIKTIDGEVRTLKDHMLVIADATSPVAVAGVMGGADSEVGEGTTRILLESAWFDPSSVRRTAKALAMNTEASQRFQRGADPEMAEYAANRVTRLIGEVCQGQSARGMLDVHPNPLPKREISLRFDRTNVLLGTDISGDSQCSILERLYFAPVNKSTTDAHFSVPSWRHDATREADLIEEIARLYGYENIPSTVPRVRKADTVFAPLEVETRKLRRYLASIGLTEIMSLTFSSADDIRRAGLTIAPDQVVRLLNPLSETSSVMRVSLLPNLLATASLNIRRGTTQIKAFELGHVYLAQPQSQLPHEGARLGVVLSGTREDQHWGRPSAPIDIFDLKGIIENLLETRTADFEWRTEDAGPFEAGYSGVVESNGAALVRYGKVKPAVTGAFDIEQDVFLAEFDLDALLAGHADPKTFEAPSAFPPSLRDIAVLVDAAVPARAILDTARNAGGRMLRSLDVFDVYTGKPIPAGKKSVALGLVFQSAEKTLTDKDTQKAWDSILKALEKEFQATLR